MDLTPVSQEGSGLLSVPHASSLPPRKVSVHCVPVNDHSQNVCRLPSPDTAPSLSLSSVSQLLSPTSLPIELNPGSGCPLTSHPARQPPSRPNIYLQLVMDEMLQNREEAPPPPPAAYVPERLGETLPLKGRTQFAAVICTDL